MEDPFAELTRGANDGPPAPAGPFEAITRGAAERRRRNLALYIGIAGVLAIALFLGLRACGATQEPLPGPDLTPIETPVNLVPKSESPTPTPTSTPTSTPTPADDPSIDDSVGISDQAEDDDTVVLVIPNDQQDMPGNDGLDLDPRFQTCGAALAAGFGNYRAGIDPEYDWYWDRDGDGVVCER